MNTKKKLVGIAIAAAAAATFAVTPVASAIAGSKAASMGKCFGMNKCKGKSACATAHTTCKGHNACKGKGWKKMNKKVCKKKGGKWVYLKKVN